MLLSLLFMTISWLLTKVFCSLARDTRLMDKPNERSMHVFPTIRGGGLIFIGLFLLFLLFQIIRNPFHLIELPTLFLSTLLIAAIGFIDDLNNLSAKTKFIVQAIATLPILVFIKPEVLDLGLLTLTNQWLILPFLFFTILWAINHFNFMDGLDGFCAIQAIFLLSGYAIFLSVTDAFELQTICFVLITTLLVFLVFNFPPAKLFMGDIGSTSLGFVTIVIAIIAQNQKGIPIIYWFILNGIFLFDSTVTLIRRVIHKEKWFTPHKLHAYQRLKQAGVSTRTILFAQAMINSLLLIIALLALNKLIGLISLLVLMSGLLLTVYLATESLLPMFKERG